MSDDLIARLRDNRISNFDLSCAAIDAADELESLRQKLAVCQAALQAVSDDWDGEHFHSGGDSFMPAVNKALGRGEQ